MLVPLDPETGKPVPKKDREKFLANEKSKIAEARDHEGRLEKQLKEQSRGKKEK